MTSPPRRQRVVVNLKTEYSLGFPGSSATIDDDGLILAHPDHPGALLRSSYAARHLTVGEEHLGFYKFAQWLPANRFLAGSSAPVTFRSERLAASLGLRRLYVTFSGYWPERAAFMLTGTFKECEAYAVCARLPEDFRDVLVVASAGNTARAFARVCSENGIRLALIVPDAKKHKLWFKEPLHPCVKLVTVGGNSDYYDAIRVADEIARHPGFVAEGGARNMARRDGMGTTVLSAVTTIGEIPDYYFQAIGSGTGVIAAWEANQRFNESGRYGVKRMSLQAAQNEPFTPMYDAWRQGSRDLLPMDEEESKGRLAVLYADVLANRKPPYAVRGGVYDALSDAGGQIHAVTNEEAKRAAARFAELEGIDIEPAAAVATAALTRCVDEGAIDRDALTMLNITGGGFQHFRDRHVLNYLQPSLVLDVEAFDANRNVERVLGLF